MSRHHLVFQAYGHKPVLLECKYALFTLAGIQSISQIDFLVTLYTDQPEFFKEIAEITGLRVETRIIAPQELEQWRGPQGFVHRVKIGILQDFAANHQGSILYCDTDVVFLKSLDSVFEQIDAGKSIMHTLEGPIQKSKNRVLNKLHHFLKANASDVSIWAPHYFQEHIDMWNAGVIGFQAKNATLLEEVLMITDRLYKIYNKHIAEQFAFSYTLRKNGPIVSADAEIRHYWNFKEFRPILEHFFDTYPTDKAFELMHLIDPISLEAPKRKYESLPGWRRALRKLYGVRWRMPHYHLP